MKSLINVVSMLVLVCLLMPACKKNKKVSKTVYNYSVNLSGIQEVPANNSTASGNFVGSYDQSTNILSFTLTYSGFTPIAWHIHKGAVAVSGPVEISLGDITSSPLQTSITLTDVQEADLLNDLFYVNVHSAAFPAGEIRAQLSNPTVVVSTNGTGY